MDVAVSPDSPNPLYRQLYEQIADKIRSGAMARGELTMSGWVYEIGTGEVRIAQEGQREFVAVTVATGAVA